MRSREFHQIAGRAGRKGFDDEGDVMAEPGRSIYAIKWHESVVKSIEIY